MAALNKLLRFRRSLPIFSQGFAAQPKQRCCWGSSSTHPHNLLLSHFSSNASDQDASRGGDVAVSQDEKKKSKLFPRRRPRQGSLVRNYYKDDHLVPALWDLFPSGLGNALVQASENINRLLEQLGAPPGTVGQVREKDDHYKLRMEVPGLAKEELKITVEDGVLHIRGEHKELEDGEESDEEQQYWSRARYGYYGSNLVLPEDAKTNEIKAEMKDGVLTVIIPKSERAKKDAKEIKIE